MDFKDRKDALTTEDFCCECGMPLKRWLAYERRGKLYCGEHLLNTAEKRAYEAWHVPS